MSSTSLKVVSGEGSGDGNGVSGRPPIQRRRTRSVRVRDLIIGSEGPISVQSMCATKTQDIEATCRLKK